MTPISIPRVYLPVLSWRGRYVGLCGGRGSGKSHFVASLVAAEALHPHFHCRIACVREVQNSVRDSVKRLIEDKIESWGVRDRFRITDREIVGPAESLIIFRGLSKVTAASIKSLEGFNRVWYEEAQTLSQRSLELATPTFRTPGTQQRFTWNPYEADDPVDKFFRVGDGDPNFLKIVVNYYDNPWFPDSLRIDMERDKLRDSEKYAHVWLGQYHQRSDAQVFSTNWKVEPFDSPPPGKIRFYFGADFGHSEAHPTVLIRCFIDGRTLYIDREAWAAGSPETNIDRLHALFDRIPGARDHTITADCARPDLIEYMQRHGFPRMEPSKKGANSIIDGIDFIKSYDVVIHPDCKHVVDEFKSYCWKVDPKTLKVLDVLEDKKNHTIDAVRYALEDVRHATRSGTQRLII